MRNFLSDEELMDLFHAHWGVVQNERDLIKLSKSKGYFNPKGEEGEDDHDGDCNQGGGPAKVYLSSHLLFEERSKELGERDYGEESDYEQDWLAV